MKLVESILVKNPCYTTNRKIAVKGLMLHSVGCPQPSAKVFINMWNKETYRNACVHGFIDANDGVVYKTLPWNHRGWHAGGSANNTHIGVEMCEPACIKYTSGSSFTCSDIAKAKACVKRCYDSAVELFAMLCKEYKLNPLAKGVIISHHEGNTLGVASNHGDPEHLWKGLNTGYTMDGFRKDVAAAMETVNIEISTATTKREVCEVTLDKLVKGSKGNSVKALQILLIGYGYSCGSCGADGSFGAATDSAVRAYQKSNGLTVDGIVGPGTWTKLLR